MRIIPVLDLKQGQAVRAVAGDRAHYGPVRSVLHDGSDPVGLACAYRDRLGSGELYLADLDAITGQRPPDIGIYEAIRDLGIGLWIDAGIREAPTFRVGEDRPGHRECVVVLGLETLNGPDALRAVSTSLPPGRIAFSLDLRGGRPIVAEGADWRTDDPARLAESAVACGLNRIIVLDLARVGTARGVGTLRLLARLHGAHPDVELIAGGGVSGRGDLDALAAAGVSAVLIGSALHDGRALDWFPAGR
jgi:phosphoribosylformimino-5-aminoimidazole carboxamide ribotide isomerase